MDALSSTMHVASVAVGLCHLVDKVEDMQGVVPW